jgi:hypothetical protein
MVAAARGTNAQQCQRCEGPAAARDKTSTEAEAACEPSAYIDCSNQDYAKQSSGHQAGWIGAIGPMTTNGRRAPSVSYDDDCHRSTKHDWLG